MPINLDGFDFSKATIISRQRGNHMAGAKGTIYVPLETVTVYFDDKAAEVRQVLTVAVTVNPKGEGVKGPHPRHQYAQCRLTDIRGFCPEQNNWGKDGYQEGNRVDLEDEAFTYQDAHSVFAQAMNLAQSDGFQQYQGGGTYYRK